MGISVSEEQLFMRRIHSREVAEAAGVSLSTLSKVLNGREIDRIPEGTRQRVLQIVQDMNYVPRSQMRELRTGRTGRIGVLLVTPFIFLKMDPYHQRIFDGIVAGAQRYGRNLVLYTAHMDTPEALRRDVLGGSADGVLLVGDVWTSSVQDDLHRSHIPAVYISSAPGKLQGYYLADCDNVSGGRLAIERLLALGHRHIVIRVEPDIHRSYQKERLQGAMAAIATAQENDPAIRGTVIASNDVKQFTEHVLADLSITAVFHTLSEAFAGEFMATVMEHGRRIPEDISVVGFDSTEVAERFPVPLTAIAQPFSAIGEAAVEMLVALIDGAENVPQERRLPVRLDERASTAPARIS
jgi:LacI family transcriptional regulator